MDPFARIIVGYHGCEERFVKDLLLGKRPIPEWEASDNDWDWLGHGIYFWEHSPERALRWAREKFPGKRQRPAVIGGYIQLGRCFDLLNESVTAMLGETYTALTTTFSNKGLELPKNRGDKGKRRELDCFVINKCLDIMKEQEFEYDTVRGAFLEGEPVYPTASFSRESHIQIAVRNPSCILGVFRPNLQS
jgi:hypothetical protein